MLLQCVDKFEATAIPATTGSSMPFLSPDGSIAGFAAMDGSLKSVSSGGDAPAPLASLQVHSKGATFGPAGQLIVGQNDGGLLHKTVEGSWAKLNLTADSERGHAWPEWITGEEEGVFTFDYVRSQSGAGGVARHRRCTYCG